MSRFLGFLARRARADARTTGRGTRTRTRDAGATTDNTRRRHDRPSSSSRAARAPARVPRTGASDPAGFATGRRPPSFSQSFPRGGSRGAPGVTPVAAARPPALDPSSTPRTNADLAVSLPRRSLLSRQDQTTEVARRKKRSIKTNHRSLVGASLEVIQKKRSEKTEVRAAARDAALREIKERQRKAKDSKKGKK